MGTGAVESCWKCTETLPRLLVGLPKYLPQKQVSMAARVVLHGRDELEAALRVKRGSLERERHENHLRAAAPAALLLGGRE